MELLIVLVMIAASLALAWRALVRADDRLRRIYDEELSPRDGDAETSEGTEG